MKKENNQKILCYETVARDGGEPNYLVNAWGQDGKFSRSFWMSGKGKFLKPANQKIWTEWPKKLNPQPELKGLPVKLTKSALRIFGQIGQAIKNNINVVEYINAQNQKYEISKISKEKDQLKKEDELKMKNLRSGKRPRVKIPKSADETTAQKNPVKKEEGVYKSVKPAGAHNNMSHYYGKVVLT